MSGPCHEHVGKGERMAQVKRIVDAYQRISTQQVAEFARCTVHRANRALDRLARRGEIRKAGRMRIENSFVNVWEAKSPTAHL